ncbi:hypothetical protein PENTCL1PPCAC_15633 [Pristionchus entomophagus]|uniref:G protein-coupled receptor n=1 Tax=Pristionchus entomophagus TaxID=358040 RepID=A0AAV5TFL1_9BILA|nr:hypothetical protein PENTCL1PPCAC_15633 [Pristionchus entomophagus]
MNESYLLFQAQYLHDSSILRWLVSIKLILAIVSIPLLIKIRKYKSEVLVHASLSILMRFHYFYICILVFSSGVDYFMTLFWYQSVEPRDYVLSCRELFLRRFPQMIGIYGSLTSMFMMSIERFTASSKFRTYESSRKNTVYFWTHISMVMVGLTVALLAYDCNASYPVSTGVPPEGREYHQMIAAPITLIELLTVYLFEYLFRLNTQRLKQTGFSLTERYQIAENIRILELMRPLARFHRMVRLIATSAYLLFGRRMENGPNYPIFEESINFVQLQGILLPLFFMRHERKERARRIFQLQKNSSTSGDYVARHNAQITRGW